MRLAVTAPSSLRVQCPAQGHSTQRSRTRLVLLAQNNWLMPTKYRTRALEGAKNASARAVMRAIPFLRRAAHLLGRGLDTALHRPDLLRRQQVRMEVQAGLPPVSHPGTNTRQWQPCPIAPSCADTRGNSGARTSSGRCMTVYGPSEGDILYPLLLQLVRVVTLCPAGCIRREERGGGPEQKFVDQKWPKSIFPFVNVIFGHCKTWVRGGGVPGG